MFSFARFVILNVRVPTYDFSRPRFNLTISDCLLSTTQKPAP